MLPGALYAKMSAPQERLQTQWHQLRRLQLVKAIKISIYGTYRGTRVQLQQELQQEPQPQTAHRGTSHRSTYPGSRCEFLLDPAGMD